MSGAAVGGNDLLIGGGNSGSGHLYNLFHGDGYDMSDTTTGGKDILRAGAAPADGGVSNDMWGDAEFVASTVAGGKDLFVFADHCSMTVGTHNTIHDFSQAQGDQIQFSHVAGVSWFSDLSFVQSGADTIITAGADQVTLLGVSASTLQASDFRFS